MLLQGITAVQQKDLNDSGGTYCSDMVERGVLWKRTFNLQHVPFRVGMGFGRQGTEAECTYLLFFHLSKDLASWGTKA